MAIGVREAFLARRTKLERGLDSGGGGNAMARLDALIIEMSRTLGADDPDTLTTKLRYVEYQSTGQGDIYRGAGELVKSTEEILGADDPVSLRARFLALFENLSQLLEEPFLDAHLEQFSEQAQREASQEAQAERLSMASIPRRRFV